MDRWVGIDAFFEAMDTDDWADREVERQIEGEAQIAAERDQGLSLDVPHQGRRD
jgi:hypothetical protein